MADRIKGITVQIGGDTTGLDKALSGVNKNISNTQKQLRDVERLLKMDPGNTELLRQKYELLSNQVNDTETKLNALKEAERQVQEQFERGEVSQEQYFSLQREIIETEQSLRQLRTEADRAENAMNGIDERPLEEVAAAADDAEEQLEQAGREASNFGDYLKAEVIVEGAKSIITSLKDVAEESKEYMKIMGSLGISSEKAGYSAEQTEETFKSLYGVLADEQSAATTTANLQAIGLRQEQLVQITDAAIGAWATYGDSIPIDGLAEAINHTSQLGEVQGTLADVLEWAGVSVDDFNAQLAECSNTEERANLILKQLTKQGLTDAGKAWKKNNKALVESNQANAEMQKQMAKLGETILPVMTQITEVVARALEAFNGLDESQQKAILTIVGLVAVLGPVIPMIGGITNGVSGLSGTISTLSGTVLPAIGNAFSSVFGFIATNPIVLLIAAIVGLVALIATKGDEIQILLQKLDDFLQNVFATDWTELFDSTLGEVLNTFFTSVKEIWDSVKQIFDGIIDFIAGVFTADWERVWKGVQEIFGGIFNGLVEIAQAPINGIIGLLNMAVDAVNDLITGFNSIGFDMPEWLGGGSWHPNIPLIPNIPMLAKGGILSGGTAIVGEAGPEILTVSGNQAIVQPLTGSAAAGKGLSDVLNLLSTYLPYLAESQGVVLDSGELVGTLTPRINNELGMIAQREVYQ